MNMRKPVLAFVGLVVGIFLLVAAFLAYHPDLHHPDHEHSHSSTHSHSHSHQDCGICAFAHLHLLSDVPVACFGVGILAAFLFFLPRDFFVFIDPQFTFFPTRGPPSSLGLSF